MHIFNKIILIALLTCGLAVAGCHKKDTQNTIRVGTIDGPETQLMVVAKEVAEKKYGLKVEIVPFNDYTMPNVALSEGSIDANVFQHQPYLDEAIASHHFRIQAIGKTFIYPVAIYSKKIKKLDQLHPKAVVTIPNDPSNETRALLLLQDAHLLTLNEGKKSGLTLHDIKTNPLNLQIKELDAALIPRALEDADLAVINTNYAVPAGLLPTRDGLFVEPSDSPYGNLIVVRTEEVGNPHFKQLEAALHSDEVQQAAKALFHGTAIPAWHK